jgi:hypothetical protein
VSESWRPSPLAGIVRTVAIDSLGLSESLSSSRTGIDFATRDLQCGPILKPGQTLTRKSNNFIGLLLATGTCPNGVQACPKTEHP